MAINLLSHYDLNRRIGIDVNFPIAARCIDEIIKSERHPLSNNSQSLGKNKKSKSPQKKKPIPIEEQQTKQIKDDNKVPDTKETRWRTVWMRLTSIRISLNMTNRSYQTSLKKNEMITETKAMNWVKHRMGWTSIAIGNTIDLEQVPSITTTTETKVPPLPCTFWPNISAV